MRSKYNIKTETLGCDIDDRKEKQILNKVVRINADGLELEAGPRHAEFITREFGLVGCKPSRLPGAKAVHIRAATRCITPIREVDQSEGETAAMEAEGEC